MQRLIDANILINSVETDTNLSGFMQTYIRGLIREQPTVEPSGLTGWICPICGRGLSPFTYVCPCQGGKGWEITCG